MTGRLWTILAAALVALTAVRTGKAQELDLVWQAPDTCPSSDQVKNEFRRSLRLSAGHVPPNLSATAVVENTAGRWALHLHIVRNGVGSDRELEADSCNSLARATALVLSLALGEGDIDQQPVDASAASKGEPPPAPAAAPPAAPAPPATAPPPSDHPRGKGAPLSWAPALEARSAWGPVPGPSLSLGVGLDMRSSWWGLSARAVSWPSVTQSPAPGLQTTYEAAGGALSVCVLPPAAAFVLFELCGGLEATAVRGASSGGTRPGDKVAPWYAGLGSLRARVPLIGRVHLELGFELAVSLTRPSFAVEGLGDVYDVPRLSPSAIAGLSYAM